MWRPWSKSFWTKNHVRLAIAPNSVALRDAAGKTHLVASDASLDLTQNFKALNTLLDGQRALLAGQSVEVVLAHSFVRFLVLPWQQVMREQDWQAIARHAFKKTFGHAAADWHINVQLSGYKKPVAAAALDQATIAGLQQLADTYGFNIARIAPLANCCAPQSAEPQQWIMIAEPQRLLLIQREAGAWQQIWVDAPPAGAEQQHAEQLVQRTLQLVPSVQLSPPQRPTRVAVFVSAQLQPDWQKKSQSMLQLINPLNQQAPHAAWMGGLSMRFSQFDFAPARHWVSSWQDIILCVFAFVLIGLFYWLDQTQTAQLAALQTQQVSAQPKKNDRQSDTQFASNLAAAQHAQHALNLPWLETLAMLEQVKKSHPSIRFLTVEPNANRAQIYVKVKAKDFAAITQFLEALKTVALFGNAELTNQFAEDENFSVYEIKMDWKI